MGVNSYMLFDVRYVPLNAEKNKSGITVKTTHSSVVDRLSRRL